MTSAQKANVVKIYVSGETSGGGRQMNSNLVPFTFEGREVRTLTIDGAPWFVAADLCAILGYKNARDAISKHVDQEDKGVTKRDTLGGSQRHTIINESGLYALIFGSQLLEAKRFKRWVTHEVLPQIRRTGQYTVAVPAVSEFPKPWELVFSDSFRRNLFRLLGITPCPSGKTPLRVGKAYWHLLYNRVGNGVSKTLRAVNPRAPHKPWRLRQLHRHLAQGEATDRFKIMAVKCEAVMTCFETYTAFLSHWDTLYPPIGSLPRGLKAQLADNRQLLLRFE